MSDRVRTENYKTSEVRDHDSLVKACEFLNLKYKSVKNYFSRTKARIWLSPDKTLKIEKI